MRTSTAMERSIYCSTDLLRRSLGLDSTDWRKIVLKKLNAIYINSIDIKRQLPNGSFNELDSIDRILDLSYQENTLTETEAIELDEGISEDPTLDFQRDLEDLRESFGERMLHIGEAPSDDEIIHGAICEEMITNPEEYLGRGIAIINPNKDPEISSYHDHLYDTTDPNESFSWSSFLCKPLPPSNSLVIIDRYLFETKKENIKKFYWGAKNLVDLLKTTVPKSPVDTYPVVVIFEFDQLVGNPEWKNYISIKECLSLINSFIYRQIKDFSPKMAEKVRLSYIGIKDPKKGSSDKINAWRNLHNHIHDRFVISSYYWISASGGLSVSTGGSDDNSNASRWQNVHYMEFLYGAGHPYQKLTALPLFKIMEYLNKLSELFEAAPSESYVGFFFNKSKKEFVTIEDDFHLRTPLLTF